MEHTAIILILACCGAFFMAFNNGANDVANAFASAVGSKAITIKQALVIAAILNFVGAILLGSQVAKTLIESVLSESVEINAHQYVVGMIASLLASGIFVLLSTLTGMPVSSTHAIVGSFAGVGIVLDGFSAVNWGLFGIIGLFWIITPLVAGAFAWGVLRYIRKKIYKKGKKGLIKRFINRVPLFVAFTVGLLIFSVIKRSEFADSITLGNGGTWVLTVLAFVVTYGVVRMMLARWLAYEKEEEDDKGEEAAEGAFRKLQVGASCYVAFAHGANDVSNSISPVVAIFFVLATGKVPIAGVVLPVIPLWILILGGVGMAVGIALLGHKVMATLGKKITLMNNSKGFSVDFATATTVVLATILAMPVSSTHAATGAVIGVALDKGRHGLNFGILIKIFSAWVVTVPAAAVLTVLLYWLLDIVF